ADALILTGTDGNGDGTPDAYLNGDTDGDGVLDYLDLDADNDGIADVVEVGGTDANGDGRADNYADTDGDGFNDVVDGDPTNVLDTGYDGSGFNTNNALILTGADDNGDGTPEAYSNGDTDGDGVLDHLDLDADNDGIADVVEAGGTDANGDGRADNYADTDGDGFNDVVDGDPTNTLDAGVDTAGANTADALILTGTDDNGDGTPDAYSNGDTDGDGVLDHLDLDADNDGIADVVEAGGTDSNGDGRADNYADTDGDGFNDVVDGDPTNVLDTGVDTAGANTTDALILTGADGNGDGIPDAYPNGDTDGDGVLDHLDLDADNDGIADVVEAGGTDANGDGRADNYADTDGDGFNDVVDGDVGNVLDTGVDTAGANTADALILTGADGNGDGTPDTYPNGDFDGDGILNQLDLDSDNDGILDVVEAGGTDDDRDGVADNYADSDNDGFNDLVDGDVGNDGTSENTNNVLITTGADTDNNGAPNSYPNGDSDLDGYLNFLDIDADNDGIPDNIEGQPTVGYIAPSGSGINITDANNNGVDDNYENGTIIGLDVEDTDSDEIPDYLDSDSDGDSIPDIRENGDTNVASAGDSDGDGLLDVFDDNDDSTANGHTVNDGLDPSIITDINSLVNSFGDLDNDVTTMGNLDYRDTTVDGVAMITQVYQFENERWIEVTNISTTNSIAANLINIQLYNSKTGDQTGILPDVTYTVSSELAVGQSVIIGNGTNSITNINNNAVVVTNVNLTNIEGADDIITLSRTTDATSYENRYDVIESFSNKTSYVRIDETLAPNENYTPSEWVVFIDDALDPYRTLENGSPERHPHDPLISEIVSSNSEANSQLGLHRIDITTRESGDVWSNGFPDRSRFVVIDNDYNHIGSRFSARKLTVNTDKKLAITDSLLVVTNNIVLDGEIRLVSTDDTNKAQLVQTHSSLNQVTGSGKLLIDQNSEVPSLYRYNYMSSPVVPDASSPEYTVEAIFKDGTNRLTYGGEINNTETGVARDITWVGGYDGDTTTPISLADYWIYTFAPSTAGYSNWFQARKSGVIGSGEGFIFKGPGRPQNYTLMGSPNDGEFNTPLALTGDQEYLIGNPYVSALNVNKFIEDNINSITGSLYFWEHHQSAIGEGEGIDGHIFAGYIGGYGVRNRAMGLAANSPDNTSNDNNGTSGIGGGTYTTPGPYVAVAQGFMVVGDSNGGDVEFNNSQREYITEGTESVFFKTEETIGKTAAKDESTLLPIIKLGFSYKNEEELMLHRQLGISFKEGNSFEFNKGFDAEVFDTGKTDIYWKLPNDEMKYAILGVQEISEDLEIPLEIVMDYSGDITLTIDEMQNVPENVYIKDKLTGVSYQVVNNIITLTLDTGVYSDRFVLGFKEDSVLGLDDDLISNTTLNIYADNTNNKLVLTKQDNLIVNTVQLYNVLGKQVGIWEIDDEQKNYHEFDVKEYLPTGVYIVKVSSSKGSYNKKVLVD
ncbi:T9SS type A sorting domain-containing protein, partial [Polaribacter sargassicola]|uniref:T9SS type A sorting domain-containing protein n=1 Tax=Polaribacter sargassicola TaxID=2836891 RepID=UPI001F1F4BDE